MTNFVFLGLGSNLGDREDYLRKAIDLIKEDIGDIDSFSGIYETEPWGFRSENNFLNIVIRIQTSLPPVDLLKQLMKIEDMLGRERSSHRFTSRTIDIDILLYGNLIINLPELIIPHPMMHERKFVLEPFCDISPETIHPVLKKPFSSLLKECKDRREVKRIKH